MNRKIAIAIDGPAAAGKSTIAKHVAQELGYLYIDTGAMYRALTYQILKKGTRLKNSQELNDLLKHTDIKLKQNNKGQQVLLNEKDITEEIRSQEITNQVSHVAKHPNIRKEMMKRQQALSTENGVVMDGRDIGTHVLPSAELKYFLIATVEERARRRYEENIQKGFQINLVDLKEEIEQRDLIDSSRENAPLVKAKDAIEIDTTSLSIEEVANIVLKKARKIIDSN